MYRFIYPPLKDLFVIWLSMTCHKNDCSICLECLDGCTKKDYYTTICNHEFHKSCLRRWICSKNTSCPLCRTSIINTPTKSNAYPITIHEIIGSLSNESILSPRNVELQHNLLSHEKMAMERRLHPILVRIVTRIEQYYMDLNPTSVGLLHYPTNITQFINHTEWCPDIAGTMVTSIDNAFECEWHIFISQIISDINDGCYRAPMDTQPPF